MRFFSRNLLVTLLFGLPLFGQAVLDDFSTSRLNHDGGALWNVFTGQTGGVSSGMFTFTTSAFSRTPVDIVSWGPIGQAPSPWQPQDCSAGYTCFPLQTASAQNWPDVNGGVRGVAYWSLHNIVTTGTGCSTQAQYVDQDGYQPTLLLMSTVDSTHYWFRVENGWNDTCTLVSGQIYQNCASGQSGNACGGTMQFSPGQYLYPWGFAGQNVKSGTFVTTMNRLRFKFRSHQTADPISDDSNIQIGMYTKEHSSTDPSQQGGHPYNGTHIPIFANQWYQAAVTRKFDHMSGGGVWSFPEDRSWNVGNGVHYMDSLTRFYISTSADSADIPSRGRWSNATIDFDDFVFSSQSGEPEGVIASMFWGYSGPISGYPTGRYDVGWMGPLNIRCSYEVRYSSTSMKVNGFSSGTSGGSAIDCWNSTTEYYRWHSNDIAASAGQYIGIRPTFMVGQAYTGGSGDIIVSSGNRESGGDGADLFMATGSHVTISGVSGCTAANGSWTVTQVPRDRWYLIDTSVNPSVPGTLSSVVVSSGVATATMTVDHGLEVGRLVTYMENDQGLHFVTPVLSVPTTKSITFSWAVADGTYNGGSGYIYAYDGIRLNGSGACNSAFVPSSGTTYPTLVSTDDTSNFTELAPPSAVNAGGAIYGGKMKTAGKVK